MFRKASRISPPPSHEQPTNGKPKANGHCQPGQKLSYYPLATRLAFRNDFVSGKGKLSALAQKYGVKLLTAEQWAFKEKWSKLRKAWIIRAQEKFDRQGEPQNNLQPLPASSGTNGGGIAELEIQKLEIARAMREAKSGRELRDLAMAQKLVWDTWSLVTGHPRPGTRRQARKGQAARSGAAEFVPLDEGQGSEPAPGDPPAA